MPSLRTTNVWPIASATEGAPAPRGVAVVEAQSSAAAANGPATVAETAATNNARSPAAAGLPPDTIHASALVNHATQGLGPPLEPTHLAGAAGLNGPLTAPVEPQAANWPPDPFQSAPTPASRDIWQAAMRADPESIAAPRPTMVFGYAPGAGSNAAFDGLPVASYAPTNGNDIGRHSPSVSSDAHLGPALLPAPRATFVPKANDPERRARKGQDNVDNAAVMPGDSPLLSFDAVPLDASVAASPDADGNKQQVFEQAALAASFAPLSAQILQQRAAEERRWRDRLRRRHVERGAPRVAGPRAGERAPARVLPRGTDDSSGPWRR